MNNILSNLSPLKITLLCLGLLYLIGISGLFQNCTFSTKASKQNTIDNQYLGDISCGSCHQQEYKDWLGSHHDLAMQEANDSTVLADFNDVSFSSNGVTTRFFKRDDKFFVNTEDENGSFHDFEVLFTFGVYPLQQYLVQFPGGRLQCLLVAWDSKKGKWFDLMPQNKPATDDWLHWTGGSMTWNTMCADCHSTNLRKNFNTQSKTYTTEWDIIDVSCEACHGPGGNHLQYIESDSYQKGTKINGSYMYQIPGTTKQKQVDDCARCHSRRGPITNQYIHGDQFLDHYLPTLIDPSLYHTDGQILEEVYVYGSFLQSKMYHNDVGCMDCHNPHSLDLKFTGNDLCTQCHIKQDYDTKKHHFHLSDTEASQCINCHMTGKTYMGNDFRRDHSFRVPRPDLSMAYSTPNACNECHLDKSEKWAKDAIEKWYGKDRVFHYSSDLAALYNGEEEVLPSVIEMIGDTLYPDIIQASIVASLGDFPLPESQVKLIQSLKNPDPLIRHSAITAFNNQSQEDKFRYLTPLLEDTIRAVRIQAAYTLADIPEALFPKDAFQKYQKASNELEEAMAVQADFPAGQLMRGQYYHKKGMLVEAEKAYLESSRQDPYLAQPYFNLANLSYQQKNFPKAVEYFLQTIKRDSAFVPAYYSLGLLLAEMNDITGAEKQLSLAARLSGNPRYYYNWGLTLQNLNRPDDAENAYLAGLSIELNSEANLYALSILYIQQGKRDKARKSITRLLKLNPDKLEYLNLMNSL